MQQCAEGKVCEEKAPDFLPHEGRRPAAQHAPCPAQMCLQFVERRPDFPALVVECREVGGRRARRLEHGRDESVMPKYPPTALKLFCALTWPQTVRGCWPIRRLQNFADSPSLSM